jgi:hypothetical protein
MEAREQMTNYVVDAACGQKAGLEEVERERARGNFVRAASLARQLSLDEQTVRELQRAALSQFLAEFQNFEGAARLVKEYGFTAEELRQLVEQQLARPELVSQQTFSLFSGKPGHLSIAEQIRRFAEQQISRLKKHERKQSS